MTQGKQSFMRGAFILGAAAFFIKLLGAVYKVPYQNITGNEGMFVYQQVYPLYSTLLTIATAGIPIAISKLVSEKLASGNGAGAQRLFKVTSIILSISGLFFFILLYVGAPWVAKWMGSESLLTLPIQSVSFALLVVPLMSVIRGYFQGHQNMTPTAVSQMVEQSVRVATILLLAWWFMSSGAGVIYAGAGAVFGAFTGAAAGLIVLLVYWRKSRQTRLEMIKNTPKETGSSPESALHIFRNLLVLSIPICLGSLVLPLLSLVDSFTVANLLEAGGWSNQMAVEQKGIYDRGQPLIQFAAFFATALALSIVPAIAEAQARQSEREILERSSLALRLTLIMGLPASVGLAVVAQPTNVMLYKDDAGSLALAILALTTLFSTLGMTSSGILQGIGRVMLPARNLLIGVGVKLLLNVWLVPLWDIRGAALATVGGYAVASCLNLIILYNRMGPILHLRRIGLPLLVANGLMAAVSFGTVQGVLWLATEKAGRLGMTVAALSGVLAGALFYAFALLKLGILSREEMKKVPKIGAKIVPILERYHLFKS
ncbi:polysaccharide biosynthesis protein [Kroppenstedtia pulmonis]|uniref:Polysaccharide biosynthesis protein n=1 Tax=Kroppenstedtia pulmonis TaxID=1380685 RepID=A0A7D3XNL9_9BACL|nr:polysaccharide biosynthesis protein [Kroppenstedtia pulmonis]QKG83087.1 polysaccharide biosynthesis protein [Kroppenstedtia pulmonis]